MTDATSYQLNHTHKKQDIFCPRSVEFILLALLALAPLPLGSNRPVFEGLIMCAASLGLVLWGVAGVRAVRRNQQMASLLMVPLRRLWGLVLLALILLGWMVLQAVPLPDFLSAWAAPVWAKADLGGVSRFISVDPWTTFSAALLMLSYAVLFFLALQLGRNPDSARRMVRVLALSASAYAFYGLVSFSMGNTHILWLEKWAYHSSLTATFVNRNAFAAYAGLGVLACITVLVSHLRVCQREISGQGGRSRSGLVLLFSEALRRAMALHWFTLFGLVVLVLAVALSTSRMGALSMLCGVGVLFVALVVSKALQAKLLWRVAVLGAVLSAALLIWAGGSLLDRLRADTFLRDERPEIWQASVEMIKAQPWTGWGMGTFAAVFEQFRTGSIDHPYAHAHSTYLEMVVELGLPAASLWLVLMLSLLYLVARGVWVRKRFMLYPALALAAMVQAGLHSLVDFSYQTPAVAVALAVVLGAGVAQSFRSGEAA